MSAGKGRAESAAGSRTVAGTLVAGSKRPVAMLTANEDGSASVTIGSFLASRIDPPSPFLSFAAAKNAPVFYGASQCGQVVAVMCNLITSKAFVMQRAVVGICVQTVHAASETEIIVFSCSEHNVWLLDLQDPSAVAKRVGTMSHPARGIVVDFAAPQMAVVITDSDSAPMKLKVLSFCKRLQDTWGIADSADLSLSPPDWAACVTCSLLYGQITAHIGGRQVYQAQLAPMLAGPPKCRTNLVMTARSAPVSSLAITKQGLLCLLVDRRLVQISEDGRCFVGTACALTNSGEVIL